MKNEKYFGRKRVPEGSHSDVIPSADSPRRERSSDGYNVAVRAFWDTFVTKILSEKNRF